MAWRDYMTTDEAIAIARIEGIRAQAAALSYEHRAIAERCRKRAERDKSRNTGTVPRSTHGGD